MTAAEGVILQSISLVANNTPGALDALKLQMYVMTSYYGTWENVTIEPYKLTSIFAVTEM